jgi:hypothetical protein
MSGLSQVAVELANPRNAQILPAAPRPNIQSGEVLLSVSKFVLTANTVTYAMAGEHPMLKYFDHFVSPDPRYALSPCWGTGIVIASKAPGIQLGARVHGFYPMGPYAVLRPKAAPKANGAFLDVTPGKRLKTIEPYRSYMITPLTTSEVRLLVCLAMPSFSLFWYQQ